MGFLRRHNVLSAFIALVLLLASSIFFWASRQLHRIEPMLNARIVAALASRFHARVELDELHLSLLRGLEAEGRGLRIWPSTDVPAAQPMIALNRFHFHTGLHLTELAWMLARNQGTVLIPLINVDGARIDLPPHARFILKPPTQNPRSPAATALDFQIDKINFRNAVLILETDKPGKLPQDYSIDTLNINHVAPGQPMQFDASLRIPRPDGIVKTSGSFGPWQSGDWGGSRLEGNYQLVRANLAVFKGIAGSLDSSGHYDGTLRQLSVNGITTTPDFRLTHFGNSEALRTRFSARVDATDGDTHLEDVTATLGRSAFKVHGDILRVTSGGSAQGHDILLTTASMGTDRVEDFLTLAGSKPGTMMVGDLAFTATFHLPPGPMPLHLRTGIDGNFQLDNALFSNASIQGKVCELSLRGQGKPDAIPSTDPNSILSTMNGDFTIQNGALKLPNLNYQVPGAQMNFNGTYLLDGGAIQFSGTAKLDAKLSQMTTGWKSSLLKTFEGAVSRDGAGTFVPINIDGTWKKPHFAIDFGRLLRP